MFVMINTPLLEVYTDFKEEIADMKKYTVIPDDRGEKLASIFIKNRPDVDYTVNAIANLGSKLHATEKGSAFDYFSKAIKKLQSGPAD